MFESMSYWSLIHQGIITLLFVLLADLFTIFVALPFHDWAILFAEGLFSNRPAKERRKFHYNPLEFIDLVGAIFVFITGFGWNKPIEIDETKFRNSASGMFGVACFGSLAYALLAVLETVVYHLLRVFLPLDVFFLISPFFLASISINVNFIGLNLIPLAPLDGSKFFFHIFSNRVVNFLRKNEKIFYVLIFFVALFNFFPFSIISQIFSILISVVNFVPAIISYWIVISFIAVFITLFDKERAIDSRWRIRESTLLLVSALGGGIAMLITMKLRRHKTRKLKFMLGIPAIIFVHGYILYYLIGFALRGDLNIFV